MGLVLLLGMVACCSCSYGDTAVSVEDYLSFANREQVTYTYIGQERVVVWVETTGGVANIFAANRSEGYMPYQVTTFDQDDGMKISIFGFNENVYPPLVYFNRRPDDGGNPLHLVSPPLGGFYYTALFSMATHSGLITALPIEARINNTLYWVDSRLEEGSSAGNLDATPYRAAEIMSSFLIQNGTVLDDARIRILRTNHGTIDGFSISPNGRAMAFANGRGDHGLIGIYMFESNRIQWVSPGYDTDVNPKWSPDSSQLSWLRLIDMTDADGRDIRCKKNGYCGTAGPAYSVMVTSIEFPSQATATNSIVSISAAKTLFTDTTRGYPDGSAGYGNRPLEWAGPELVFGCEINGFVQICKISTNGTTTVEVVTPELCDNQAFAVIGRFVYTTHNCDMVDSLGIARISLDSGVRTTVVKADPLAVVGMPYFLVSEAGTANEELIFFRTAYNQSTSIVIWNTATQTGKSIVSSYPSSFSSFIEPKLITFPSLDQQFTIHAQLFDNGKPLKSGGDKSGVIFTHGGCQRQMYAAFHYVSDYAALYATNQFLAAQGHVVLSVNYRGGPGYGTAFRAANNSGWQGASEYQDTLAGALFLQKYTGVDQNKIGIYGLSYGGLNAMQAITRNSDVFKAAVANAPVVNWVTQKRYEDDGLSFNLISTNNNGESFRTLSIGPDGNLAGPNWLGYTQANQELAWKSSPAAYLDNISSPLLLIQGDSDANVDFAETVTVVRSLRARGFDDLETLMFPDDIHGLSTFSNQVTAANATVEFLTRRLNA